MVDKIRNQFGQPDKIKAALRFGIAKPNLFDVQLTGPSIPLSDGDGGIRNVNFHINGLRCITAEIPSTNITTSEHSTYGVLRKHPSGVDYNGGQTSIAFMIDNSWTDLALIQLWQQQVYSPFNEDTEYSPVFNFKSEYVGKIVIDTITRNEEVTYRTELYDCFPTAIQTTALDTTIVDTPLMVTVDFSFGWMKRDPQNVRITGDSQFETKHQEMVGKQRTRDDIINAVRLSEESALDKFKRILAGASTFSDRAADILGKVNRLEGQVNRGTSAIDRINTLINPDG
jgi:hypothetical protein